MIFCIMLILAKENYFIYNINIPAIIMAGPKIFRKGKKQ